MTEWLRPTEAAKYAKVSTETLRKLRARGIGPRFSMVAFGGGERKRPRYQRAWLDAWLSGKAWTNGDRAF